MSHCMASHATHVFYNKYNHFHRCQLPHTWKSFTFILFDIEIGMTAGRKPQLTARCIITSSVHHQQSDPGSLVIPKLIYTQNMDILCKEPEVIGACTAGLNSVFVPVQVLWSSSLFTCWDSEDSACLSVRTHTCFCAWLSVSAHTCFCDRQILPSTIYQLEL